MAAVDLCWLPLGAGGHIPDVAEAVDSPRRLSEDGRPARGVHEATRQVPIPVWGRDELHTGEMWNFHTGEMWNSSPVVAWSSQGTRREGADGRPPLQHFVAWPPKSCNQAPTASRRRRSHGAQPVTAAD